jgi:hypothetical protein
MRTIYDQVSQLSNPKPAAHGTRGDGAHAPMLARELGVSRETLYRALRAASSSADDQAVLTGVA